MRDANRYTNREPEQTRRSNRRATRDRHRAPYAPVVATAHGVGGSAVAGAALHERDLPYRVDAAADLPAEATLTAAWLLGRVPPQVLPWPLLRAGRAGRGPGPDVREAAFRLPSGAPLAGDVEVHIRASDFQRHGHATDPAYDGVVLHVAWIDDRPEGERGGPVLLAGGGAAPTVVVGPALGGSVTRLERLVARGPQGQEPCADAPARLGVAEVGDRLRLEGQRRLAERAWRAARLLEERGAPGAWALLLDRALYATAGRRREDAATHEARVRAIGERLGGDAPAALVAAAAGARPRDLPSALQADGIGAGRALELAWNAALPLLIALAHAHGDLALAQRTAVLASAWPAPRPYGRTRALAGLLGPAERGRGALGAQGLLHVQDLWCTRGGCGVCPLS